MKHNSTVYADAYFQMGRSFAQLLTRIIAFDNLCLSLENKCLSATHESGNVHTLSLFWGIHSIIRNYTKNYVLGQNNIHQT
jgi:hypothetical protein